MDGPTTAASAGETPGQALLTQFERAGYRHVAPAILQPADVFFDLAGEEMRRRIYLTTDAGGRDWCLRPDLTIPVCRDHIATGRLTEPVGYSYLGPVFRFRGDAPGEFLQAGIESLGRRDREAADAEVLALGCEAAGQFGVAHPRISIGDRSLFAGLVDALDLPPQWRRRLLKDFNRTGSLREALDLLATPGPTMPYAGVLAALAGQDPAAAHAVVTDLLSIAGISTVGGRSAGEIAERFLEQAALGATGAVPASALGVIEQFLEISGDPDEAADALRTLAREAGIDMSPSIDAFEQRTGFFAAQGLEVSSMRFSTSFGRGLEYYSGFVFELHDPDNAEPGPLVAGGRYDELCTLLGSPVPVPAVGLACWIERLTAAGGLS
ncbi:ATP phosphoribosyltransferase regulatory subunit [Blastochloris tepida]|uniref:ATP phosphoribosyltransferase regulatory subunit n=1 Tax=Blastochloris tepida TaxID=2233851 RepID=A0A348FVU4_9HYPH|nr:ATP phosphoribosyltransferase regulatory subunit [Blastochloris tepida]BBF91427.1 ATP phosphoribosyltransferase regulatory subunit [Blastochloris tepida]